jgi:hypothetical protein
MVGKEGVKILDQVELVVAAAVVVVVKGKWEHEICRETKE